MKLYITVALSILWAVSLFAQNTTSYQYDNNNRLIKSEQANTNSQYTFDELGNRLLYTISSQASQQADLLANEISIPSTTLTQGISLLVGCKVSNIGGANATGTYLKVYLANTVNGTDIELESKYVSSVTAGGSVLMNFNITIPQNAPVGNKYLVFFADATNTIAEPNEVNNKASVAVTIQTSTLPDLTIQDQQITPTSLQAGQSTYVSANMKNIGNANSSGFWLRCYLSLNPTFESYNDVELVDAAFSFSSLNAGSTTAYSRNVNIPSNTIPGTYYLLFVADPENSISELDEENNIVFSTLTIVVQGGGNAPVSNFSVDNQIIGIGTTVQFTNLSTNNPTSWQWSFPGGTPNNSSVQNPSVTYGIDGVFDVSLTSSNSSGSNTLTENNFISVGQVSDYDWIWSKTVGIDINDLTIDIDGNIVAAGGDASTMYVAKYDPEGIVIWSKTINNCRGRAMDVSNIGEIFIVGEFSGSVNFGNNVSINNTYNDGTDGYIAKFNESGLCLWANKIYNSNLSNIPNSQTIVITDVSCDASGNSYITGYYEGLYGGSDYNILHFPNGVTLQNVNQSYNLVVAKFSSSGSTQWAKQGTDYNSTTCYFEGAAIDTDGSHVGIVGQFSGTAIFNNQNGSTRSASGLHDIFFIECSTSDGYMNAFLKYGSNNTSTNSWDYEKGNDVKYFLGGGKYICGQYSGTAQFSPYQHTSAGHADAFLMKLSSSNSTQWVVSGGSPNFDCSNDISLSPDGGIYLIGQHDIGFATEGITIDGYGTFISKYDMDGSLASASNVSGSFYNDNNGGGIEADNKSNLYVGHGGELAKYGSEGSVLHPVLQCSRTHICEDENTFIIAPEGYIDYVWSNGESTSTIVVNASGDYFVEVTDNLGNTGISDTVSILVFDYPNSILTANGSTTFCEGDYVELNANNGANLTYKWLQDGNYLTGEIYDKLYAYESGDYQVEVSNQANCSALSNTISLTSEPSFGYVSIVATKTEICEGTQVTFNATPVNGGFSPQYQWKKNGANVGGNNNVFSSNTLENGDEIRCILTASGSCISNNPVLSNIISISVISLPLSNAGSDATICHDENYLLTGIVENSENVHWSTTGDGSFDNPNGATTIYHPGINDKIAGVAILKLTVEAISPCIYAAVDQMKLTIIGCQDLTIQSGWSGVSTFINPFNANLNVLLNPILSDLIILQNASGMFWPGQNINTLGNWNTHEGFQIKVANVVELNISGSRENDKNLQLAQGWNLIPILSECAADVAVLFNATGLTIVKEVAGTGIYWPEFGINTLQVLQPGKAYFVLMNGDGEVTFPECDMKNVVSGDKTVSQGADLFGSSPWQLSTPSAITHTIAIPAEVVSGDLSGNVIGAFDVAGNCYGAAIWNSQNTSITLCGDDPTTLVKDGFVNNEPIAFRLWNSTTHEDVLLYVSFAAGLPNPEMFFAENGLSAIAHLNLSATGIADSYRDWNIQIIPNPAKDEFVLELDTEEISEGALTIYNLDGRITGKEIITGKETRVEINQLKPGVYLLKIEIEGNSFIRRLIKH